MAQVSGVAGLVRVQRTVQTDNGSVKSEPKYLACEECPIRVSAFELLFFCRSLGVYGGLTSLLFFSQSRQPSAAFSTRLCT